MKTLLTITTFSLPLGIFAQGNHLEINPPPQAQNINYYNQIDENNLLGNASGINNDINPIQTNIGNFQQQANPPAQVQQKKESGSIFGSEENDNSQDKVKCKDCEEVKKAIAAAHSSSGANHHRKSFNIKQWSHQFAGRINMKMKKVFAHHRKIKSNYEVCFNWHS